MTSDDRIRRLELAVAAHPGFTLDEEEAEVFAAEVGDLDALALASAGNAHALVLCTYAFRKLGRYDEAQTAGEQALALERTFATLTALATVHRANDDADEACPLLEEAAGLDLSDVSALMEGAKLLGSAERFDESEAWFARVLAREPDNAEAQRWHIYAGYAYAEPADEPGFTGRMRAFCDGHPDDKMAAHLLKQMSSARDDD